MEISELSMVKSEINLALNNLSNWMKDEHVSKNMVSPPPSRRHAHRCATHQLPLSIRECPYCGLMQKARLIGADVGGDGGMEGQITGRWWEESGRDSIPGTHQHIGQGSR